MDQSDELLERLPPQSVEAEQFVLGAILLDNEALYKAIDVLVLEDFYKDAHKRIYGAMVRLFDKSEPIDIVTLSEYLKSTGEIEKVGGVSYLSQLAMLIPTSANVAYHSKIVRERALMRRLISASTSIVAQVYEKGYEVDQLIDNAEKLIFEISEKRTKSSFVHIHDVVKESINLMEYQAHRSGSLTGIPSGFKDLDEMTAGLQKGDLIIIGARPSMGKTALSLNIAYNAAAMYKITVAVFSLEMSGRQLTSRLLSAEAMVDASAIRKGLVDRSGWARLTVAAGKVSGLPIYIDDSTDIGVLEIRAKARRLKMEHGLGLVVVDYLQLMKGRQGAERREQEISEISRSLKSLARELNVPVIALSQLNRLVEQRKPPIPTLADLRESGAIEQDADVILFLYRESVYNKENKSPDGKAEIHIAKQRNGPTGVVNLVFLSRFTKFVDYEDTYLSETKGKEEPEAVFVDSGVY
ncbi:MAG: replicative DNA helicase [Candidatus Magnetoovum sp. WYHC-5]|nr:replicative DNA helicase [Candidatus Magnetoovum sp. WYHC-5]